MHSVWKTNDALATQSTSLAGIDDFSNSSWSWGITAQFTKQKNHLFKIKLKKLNFASAKSDGTRFKPKLHKWVGGQDETNVRITKRKKYNELATTALWTLFSENFWANFSRRFIRCQKNEVFLQKCFFILRMSGWRSASLKIVFKKNSIKSFRSFRRQFFSFEYHRAVSIYHHLRSRKIELIRRQRQRRCYFCDESNTFLFLRSSWHFFALKRSERDFDFGLFLKNDFSSRWTQQRLSGEREREVGGGGKVRERRTPSLSLTHTHTHTRALKCIYLNKSVGQTDRQTDRRDTAGIKKGRTEDGGNWKKQKTQEKKMNRNCSNLLFSTVSNLKIIIFLSS